MILHVYNGEKYIRPKSWYIIFGTFYCFIILIFLIFQNTIGAIFMFLFGGGYLLFSLNVEKKIFIEIIENGLKIDNIIYPRYKIGGFVLELDREGKYIKNIVLLLNNEFFIYSIISHESLKEFVDGLNNNEIPMLTETSFNQSFINRLIRKLML